MQGMSQQEDKGAGMTPTDLQVLADELEEQPETKPGVPELLRAMAVGGKPQELLESLLAQLKAAGDERWYGVAKALPEISSLTACVMSGQPLMAQATEWRADQPWAEIYHESGDGLQRYPAGSPEVHITLQAAPLSGPTKPITDTTRAEIQVQLDDRRIRS